MSTVSGLEIANRVEAEWRDRLDAAVKAERNKLAAWMIRFGFATGHGDTTEDLLEELGKEILDSIDFAVGVEREMCAKAVEAEAHMFATLAAAKSCAAAIRARSNA